VIGKNPEVKKTKSKKVSEIPDIKMYLVVCGGSNIHGGIGHAALCFNIETAMAESESMKKAEYPLKGIFEISALNIFNKVPHYLKT
jgi:hypothetical protein